MADGASDRGSRPRRFPAATPDRFAVSAAVFATGTAPLVVGGEPWLWIAPAVTWPAAVLWAVRIG